MSRIFLESVKNLFAVNRGSNECYPLDVQDLASSFALEQEMSDEKFKDESLLVDSYINQNALEVLLERDVLKNEPKKFFATLRRAIELNLDDVVFDVISEFRGDKQIMMEILSSGVNKYVAKVINMPLDLYEIMIMEKDDEDGEVERYIKGMAQEWWAPQYVVVKTGCEKWIMFLLESKSQYVLSFEKSEEIIHNQKLLLELVERKHLTQSFMRKIVKCGNKEVILKFISHCYLGENVQKEIIKLGDEEVIFKLLERTFSYCILLQCVKLRRKNLNLKVLECKDLSVWILEEIADLEDEDVYIKLLERENLPVYVQAKIARSGRKNLIAKLLSREDLNVAVLKIICGEEYHTMCGLSEFDFYLCSFLERGEPDYVDAIFNRKRLGVKVERWIIDSQKKEIVERLMARDVVEYQDHDDKSRMFGNDVHVFIGKDGKMDYLEQLKILRSRRKDIILQLLERKDLNELVEADVIKMGDNELILKLFERREIGYLAQVQIVKSRNKKIIFKLLERKDLNELAEAQVIKTEDEELILKLFERREIGYLAQVQIVKSRNRGLILKLLDRKELNPLVVEDIKVLNDPEYLQKLREVEPSQTKVLRKVVNGKRLIFLRKSDD